MDWLDIFQPVHAILKPAAFAAEIRLTYLSQVISSNLYNARLFNIPDITNGQ